MGVFGLSKLLSVQPARQCPCNGSPISGTVSARAMGAATPCSIIVADMQAMAARDSFVMTSHRLNRPPQPRRSCRCGCGGNPTQFVRHDPSLPFVIWADEGRRVKAVRQS